MTRNEFISELRRRLAQLPPEEQDAALKYYEEYFDEADSEEEAARQLGSPDAIADRILSDWAAGNPTPAPAKKEHGAGYWALIITLIILASPMLLGLGAAAAGVAVGLAAVVISVVLSVILGFLAVGVVLLVCCFIFLYAGISSSAIWLPASVTLIGGSLICGGVGLLCCIFTGYLCYWTGLLVKLIFTFHKKPRKEANAK